MEDIWINPKNEQEKKQLLDMELASLNRVVAPTKEVLNRETQAYIEKRFLKTNDDSLQEAVAQKFITDSDYLDSLHRRRDLTVVEEDKILKKQEELYQKANEDYFLLERSNKINTKINELIDNLNLLEIQNKIQSKFDLSKSGISNEEVRSIIQKEIEKIRNKLNEIKDLEIPKEEMQKIYDNYEKSNEEYQNISKILNLDNPSSN